MSKTENETGVLHVHGGELVKDDKQEALLYEIKPGGGIVVDADTYRQVLETLLEDSEISNAVFKLIVIAHHYKDVYDNQTAVAKIKKWMETDNLSFGNVSPKEFIKSTKQTNIFHGVVANMYDGLMK